MTSLEGQQVNDDGVNGNINVTDVGKLSRPGFNHDLQPIIKNKCLDLIRNYFKHETHCHFILEHSYIRYVKPDTDRHYPRLSYKRQYKVPSINGIQNNLENLDYKIV